MCNSIPQKEEVEKACDKCGAKAAKHMVTHEVLRLPRVLVLHLKRFSLEPPAEEGGQYRCVKYVWAAKST